MKIGIIGGSGAMGKWFARYALAEKLDVMISGRDQAKLKQSGQELGVSTGSNIDIAKQCQGIIISVTPDQFETVVKEIAPYIRSAQYIIDVTSVKAGPVSIMHQYIKHGTVLGTHPVFGPGAKDLNNQNVVLTPVGLREKAGAVIAKGWLEQHGAHVSIMTPEEHDRIMTVVLGLAHFIAIVSADTLLSFDDFAKMKKIGGTTYKVLYTLVESVISEDPQLYASLQMSFPHIADVEAQFLKNTAAWAEMVKNGDRAGFAAKMSALHDKLEKTDPSFRQAYANMYKITEKL
jgi:prephenate dehydrogenase